MGQVGRRRWAHRLTLAFRFMGSGDVGCGVKAAADGEGHDGEMKL